jgi:hypothetical protein
MSGRCLRTQRVFGRGESDKWIDNSKNLTPQREDRSSAHPRDILRTAIGRSSAAWGSPCEPAPPPAMAPRYPRLKARSGQRRCGDASIRSRRIRKKDTRPTGRTTAVIKKRRHHYWICRRSHNYGTEWLIAYSAFKCTYNIYCDSATAIACKQLLLPRRPFRFLGDIVGPHSNHGRNSGVVTTGSCRHTGDGFIT